MKTINLKELEIFTDISRRQQVRCDVRRDLANLIYREMHGIEALNLALTIHKSNGKVEITDDELRILTGAVERFGTAALIDALASQVAALNPTTQEK